MRSQSQLAIRGDSSKWHLLNGSPDLRYQLLNFPDMLPDPSTPRLSPIQSMTITNADVDHTLGLILLRESQHLKVQSSQFVKTALLEGNAYFGMLQQTSTQVEWRAVSDKDKFEFQNADGEPSGLSAQVVALEGSAPFWAKKLYPDPEMPVMGLVIESHRGGRLGYFPCVAKVDAELLSLLKTCDAIFFDGTFWTDDEIQAVKGGKRSGKDMGHVSMSGPEGSLALIKDLPAQQKKYYIHINNTNPALNENGPEYQQVKDAGWDLAYDGLEFDL
jgi:pyrroloquinoline quinone biosynthesis protein B